MDESSGGHEQTEKVVARLSKIEGHVSGIKRMVQEGKPCEQILIQVSAVRSALNQVSKIVLDDHMKSCILVDVRRGKTDSFERLRDALNQYLR